MNSQAAVPTYAQVEQAAARLRGQTTATPVLRSDWLDTLLDAELHFKCENLQRCGAFKFRGAYNALCELTEEERRRGVIAYSSGNHAQAIALAGKLHGVRTTVVMPYDAPAAKLAGARHHGAEIVQYDRYTESREAIANSLARDRGSPIIPPYDHPSIIAGQGTVARELIAEVGALDILLVPLGGGGLLAGSLVSAARLSPSCSVYGVEPEAGDDGRQSLEKGEIVRIPAPRSIADGAVVTHLGEYTFAIIRDLVSGILTVSDAQVVAAMELVAEHLKLVVEPTGCLGLAAALAGKVDVRGKRVGLVLSGGNIDMSFFAKLLDVRGSGAMRWSA